METFHTFIRLTEVSITPLHKIIKMKTVLILIFSVLVQFSFAQTDVYLKINHFLGTSPFSFNHLATNNLGNEFTVSRLEYYISEITLNHDGGQQTHIDDLWILVNGAQNVNQYLGSIAISQLESIKFSVGVEAAFNHTDPASYPMTHPLSPKSPSMHWGWNSGYRFLAMEGLSGPNTNLMFEIHALGDANFHKMTIPTSGEINGNDLLISLNADYEKVLQQIDISSGMVVHGETGEAAMALENCRTSVFSNDQGPPTGINEMQQITRVVAYPNPSSRSVTLTGDILGEVDVKVIDVLGKETAQFRGVALIGHTIDFESKGLYLINVYQDGILISTNRVSIVQ